MEKLALSEIQIGERVRKDMGDLKSLADSIASHGLLHPIVIKTDRTLVAGHRRIEAVRLLEWNEIPVTMIDVEDLLGAERDENAERKNFTPTEAVAIGRMIEQQHKEKLKATEHERNRSAGLLSAEKRTGVVKEHVVHKSLGKSMDVASKAVGLSRSTYQRAKEVINAAESDPATFGDLPQMMDETGKISTTHTELKRREGKVDSNGKKPRHAALRKMNYPKPNREVERAIHSLDGICDVLEAIEPEQLEEAKRRDWSIALKKIGARINLFSRRISNGD